MLANSPRKSLLIITEFLLVIATLFAFFHPSPPVRENYLWLLIIPVIYRSIYLIIFRGQISLTILYGILVMFFLLTVFNYENAPYQRNNYWVVMSRPLWGIWWIVVTAQLVKHYKSLYPLFISTIIIASILCFFSLTMTDWNEKSQILSGITQLLPTINPKEFLPDAALGFNANEIAGALTWLCPLMFGISLLPSKTQSSSTLPLLWKRIALVCAIAMLFSLFLGQSRFAIAGVLIALTFFCVYKFQKSIRWFSLFGIFIMILLQIGIMQFVPNGENIPVSQPTSRDERSLSGRFELWERSLQMVMDYPTTGIGMGMFRTAITTPQYVIPQFTEINFVAPHAHNEFLQIGADLGIGGWIFFISIYGIVGWMLWQIYTKSDIFLKDVAVAIAIGFLAHGIYGLGDAIAFWDRLVFVWWILISLTNATYFLVKLGYNQN
jgi:hypothetical protein